MTHPEPTVRLTGKERILAGISHLEHLVPDQAPLRDFVHHNTLHGFQHLPFSQALSAARVATGNYGYLAAGQFRELLAQGRIARSDLAAVIAATPDLNPAAPLGEVTRGEVLLAFLEHEIQPVSASRLAWEVNERGALVTMQPGVSAENRARLLQGRDETTAITDLWHACLELFGLERGGWYREDRLDLAAEEPSAFIFDHSLAHDTAAQLHAIHQLRREASRLLGELTARVGVTLTWRGMLQALTGHDLLDEARPYLLRVLAIFMDQGMADWPLPGRQAGLYPAWRSAAATETAPVLEGFPDWNETIAELPATPLEAIEETLRRLGVAEERWGGYLERLALELPGWSGMVQWRGRRPGYQGLEGHARVTTLDYLAVRLVVEWLFAQRLCRRLWLVESKLETLGWYFNHNRAEFYVRWSLFGGELPEYLTTSAARLLELPGNDPGLTREWQKLAFRIWTERHYFGATRPGSRLEGGSPADGGDGPESPASHHHHSAVKRAVAEQGARNRAWPLFLLAQHLGIPGARLRRLGREQAEALLECRPHDELSGYLWLQAYERNYRDRICAALVANRGRGRWATRTERPSAQVIFCMDDREEGFRRHLEEHAPRVETLGAAGFFGIPVNWQGLDDTSSAALCPVVVTPSHTVRELPVPDQAAAYSTHRRRLRWGSRLRRLLFSASHRGVAAPTLLGLIAAPGAAVALLGKLFAPVPVARMAHGLRSGYEGRVTTTVDLTAPEDGTTATPQSPRRGFTTAEQVARVEGFLRAIGLTYGFAPLVAILGHGSSSQNNPHLAAYDCGACSGRHGGPNARLFAAMANRPEVRAALRARGIDIPADTWFIGGEHDTGNEGITWFDRSRLAADGLWSLDRLSAELRHARLGSAHERSRRLASAPRRGSPERALAHLERRGVDFSQSRPELGHATNAVAVIGRRSVTRGVFFDRRMFLISYDPTRDPEGRIVESILLAAGPVGAGISLEYYFSTVDNDSFGCGTKVVHNITGLLGVMEGAASDLRTGLPRQMIEIHEAMRLLVIVEQRPEVLTAIYQRQPEIRELVGNAWIQLGALDPVSGELALFVPEVGWKSWDAAGVSPPVVGNSREWYAGHTGPLPPALLRVDK